jgi:ribonuclease BN (tRNA processing enzyme)
MAVSGARYQRYGGNTHSLDVEVEPGHRLVFDCGTGLRSLQDELGAEVPGELTIFLTHYHWDHIQGLPMFGPLDADSVDLVFYGPRWEGRGVAELLGDVVRPPWFPRSLERAAANISYREPTGPVRVGDLTVTPIPLRHPQGATGYRLEGSERVIVLAFDHEAGDDAVDRQLAEAAAGADVLFHDAQYLPEEGVARAGWGHSTFETAAECARAAGVRRLVLTSHDPERSDDDMDRMVRRARSCFPLTTAAHEGMTVPI